jgi:predicted transcriptional regulator
MHMYTERTQVLLSPEQRARLERLAQDEHRSVGSIIRDAVDSYTGSSGRTRADAAARLLAMEAPVDDWETMKLEIERGASTSNP